MNVINSYRSNFKIAHSFLSDGVNEKIILNDNTVYKSTIMGQNKFSVGFVFRKLRNGVSRTLISSWGFTPTYDQNIMVGFDNTDKIFIKIYGSDSVSSICHSNSTYTDTNEWIYLVVTYDSNKLFGNRCKIFTRGIDDTGADGLGDNIRISTRPFELLRNAELGYSKVYLLNHFLLNDTLDLLTYNEWRNNNKPLDAFSFYNSLVGYLNPDMFVWDGSSYRDLLLNPSGVNWNTLLFEESDKTKKTPY